MKYLFLLAACYVFCGCVNLSAHIAGEKYKCYEGTTTVWTQGVCVWWQDPHGPDDTQAQAYIKLTYPMWLVDCPCELVLDTLTLPYDYFHSK